MAALGRAPPTPGEVVEVVPTTTLSGLGASPMPTSPPQRSFPIPTSPEHDPLNQSTGTQVLLKDYVSVKDEDDGAPEALKAKRDLRKSDGSSVSSLRTEECDHSASSPTFHDQHPLPPTRRYSESTVSSEKLTTTDNYNTRRPSCDTASTVSSLRTHTEASSPIARKPKPTAGKRESRKQERAYPSTSQASGRDPSNYSETDLEVSGADDDACADLPVPSVHHRKGEGPKGPLSLDYRDYLEGGRQSLRTSRTAFTDASEQMIASAASQAFDEEIKGFLPKASRGAGVDELRRLWMAIEVTQAHLLQLQSEFLDAVRSCCDSEETDDDRVKRKVAKYMAEFGEEPNYPLPEAPFNPAEVEMLEGPLSATISRLHSEGKQILTRFQEAARKIMKPLTDPQGASVISKDHVWVGSCEKPISLLEDLDHIQTITQTMQVSDLQPHLPCSGGTAPSLGNYKQVFDGQRLFLDSCVAAKQGLETKLTIINTARSKISADLVSPSPVMEKIRSKLVGLVRAIDKRWDGVEAKEEDLSKALSSFEALQREKLQLVGEKEHLLCQQAADIQRMMQIKRKSLCKDLRDLVGVESEICKRRQEKRFLTVVTDKVREVLHERKSYLVLRTTAVKAAREISHRQGELLTAVQKFITTHIGTAIERLHRLEMNAHEQCLDVSLKQWNGLELYYGQWETLLARVRAALQGRLGEEEEKVEECSRDTQAIMDAMKGEFHAVPEWVWKMRSFQALSDDDPVRFSDVRSTLGRGSRGPEESTIATESVADSVDDDLLPTEVWLTHLKALQRGFQTPRVGS